MRSFIAIKIDSVLQDRLSEIRNKEYITGAMVRWVQKDLIHLTLKFLGEIKPESVHVVTEAIKKASIGVEPFDLDVRGLGFFPNAKRPRVYWAGVNDGKDVLLKLSQRIDDELGAVGFDRDDKPFRAHLTLARFKGRPDRITDNDKIRQEFIGRQTVNEIVLFKSDLRPHGPLYSPLSVVTLKE